MAAELAQAVAGCARGVLYYSCDVPLSGDVGVLGDFVSGALVFGCGAGLVECRWHIIRCSRRGVCVTCRWLIIISPRLQISQHALNSFFAIFEIILPRTSPPPPLHILCLVILLACYLALAYITHATQGWYPYSFLDTSKGSGRVTGYCFGILAAIVIIFGVVWGLIWLRNLVTQKLGLDGKFAAQRRKTDGVDAWERGVEVVELQEQSK